MSFSFFTFRALALACSGIFFYMPFFAFGAAPGDVVVNEIAWMGTKASSADEWIELKNTTATEIDLSGWGIYEKSGEVRIITLTKTIAPGGYYLIERTDDNTVASVAADDTGPFGGSGLNNSGEYVALKDSAGNIIDLVDAAFGWPAGSASPDYMTMERDGAGWRTNDGVTRNGADAEGNSISGTPRAQNSGVQAIAVPAAESAPSVAPAPSPAPIPQAPIEQVAAPVSDGVAESPLTTGTNQQVVNVEPLIIAPDETVPSKTEASSAFVKEQTKEVAKKEDIREDKASIVQLPSQGENIREDAPQPALASRAFGYNIYILIAVSCGLLVWISLRRRPVPVAEEERNAE